MFFKFICFYIIISFITLLLLINGNLVITKKDGTKEEGTLITVLFSIYWFFTWYQCIKHSFSGQYYDDE